MTNDEKEKKAKEMVDKMAVPRPLPKPFHDTDVARMIMTHGPELTKMRHTMANVHHLVREELQEAANDPLSMADFDLVTSKAKESKSALAQQIAQALNRYSFLEKSDDRGMLLLISALVLLNLSDNSSDNINGTVRRLLAAGLNNMKRNK